MRKAFIFSPTSPYKSTPTAAAGGQDEFMSLLQGGRSPAPLSPEELMQNVYVMARCVDLRAGALSGLPRQLEDMKTGGIVATANFDTPPVGDDGRPLLEDELPFELELSDLLYRTGMALSVYGYAYSLIQRNRLKPLGMRWLDPKMVNPQYDPLPPRRLTHFEYDNFPLAVDDVCYVWQPGLRELEPGPAPLQAGATAAGLVLNADRFVERFFANGAMPVTLVMAEDEPGEEEKGRIKAYLSNAMRGLLNAFNVEVLGTNLKIEQLSPRLRDLDLSPISDRKEKAVCVAMGVPISIVFSGGGGDFAASAENDAIHFHEKTNIPVARLVERRLNKQFFNPLGLRLRFRPDLLEVFQQREAAKVGTAVVLFDKGAIDLDELRAAAGYDPRPVTEASKVEVPESRGGGAEEQGSGGDEAASPLPAEGEDGEEMTKGVAVPKMGMAEIPFTMSVPKMGTAVTPLAVPEGAHHSPASAGPDGEALTAELGKWRRKLVKAWGRDEALPAVPFESDILTPHQVAAVRYALRELAEEGGELYKTAGYLFPEAHDDDNGTSAIIKIVSRNAVHSDLTEEQLQTSLKFFYIGNEASFERVDFAPDLDTPYIQGRSCTLWVQSYTRETGWPAPPLSRLIVIR